MKKLSTLLIAAALLVFGEPSVAIEEPEFEIIMATEDYEIRRYAPFIVAEVDVEGNTGSADNRAFRILADYIFGNNGDGVKMAMTAPVVSTPVPQEEAVTTYAFVMEARYSMDTLPSPLDERIRIIEKPERVIAARQYSGRWSEDNYRRQEISLISALTIDGLDTRSEPFLARYNSPFTPWFMRRNEVLVELDWE